MANDAPIPPERNGAPPARDAGADATGIAPERNTATLLHGIIADVQRLIQQQLAMFRQEIQDSLRKGSYAGVILAVGAGIAAVGSAMLLLMLPLLLHWLVPDLPLWACFGSVGGVLSAVGGIVIFVGVKRIQSCHPLSNQAVEAFKENFTWTTNTK